MYADDIVLLSESSTGLQESINKTVNHCLDQGLEVNISKTKVMHINNRSTISNNFYIKEEQIENVNNYKYLGISFDSKGNLNQARSQLYGSAVRAMYKLKSCIGKTQLNVKTALNLFDSLISPILLYGCEVTNTFKINQNKSIDTFFDKLMQTDQEKLQLNFCRLILGVNNKTANVAVLGELGRLPLFYKGLKFINQFYNRAIDSDDSSLLKQAINDMLHRRSDNKTWVNWLDSISLSLRKQSLISNMNGLENDFKEEFIKYWKRKLNNDIRKTGGNKLRTYRLFKHNLSLEPYLSLVENIEHRQALTRLRVSNHKLQIEIGRHSGINIEERKCKDCFVLEDEKHFLLSCKRNEAERNKFYNLVYEQCPNFINLDDNNKMIYLMINENKSVVKGLAEFIFEGFKKL
jgi:hypothetical protein